MNQTMTEIEQKRHDWCVDALKFGLDVIAYGTCHKCGKHGPGINSILDMSFTCLMCRAEEMFPDPPKPKGPFPVGELKYGGLVPLDVDDFAKL